LDFEFSAYNADDGLPADDSLDSISVIVQFTKNGQTFHPDMVILENNPPEDDSSSLGDESFVNYLILAVGVTDQVVILFQSASSVRNTRLLNYLG
jgi:hypothetical protein